MNPRPSRHGAIPRTAMLAVLATTALLAALLPAAAPSAVASSTAPVLPIPNPLTSDWTAPSGTYSIPQVGVTVDQAVRVDLSAATITGTNNYLFTLVSGGQLTVVGGTMTGRMKGLVLDNVADGGTASVSVTGTTLTGVRTVVWANNQGGPINVVLSDVNASGLADGVRATANVIDIEGCTLTGGGDPLSGYPAGIHSLDDDADDVAVPGSYIKVFNSTITGFTSRSFQGDSIVGETRVATADIENNVLGHNSDSGGLDSKIGLVTFRNNTVYSDGDRAVTSHYGTVDSIDNTIYQVAESGKHVTGKAYQGSGTLVATGDVVTLAPGALLAEGDVVVMPASGAPSTYPRVGHLTLSNITAPDGAVLVGPLKLSHTKGYQATITVNS